MKTFNEIIKSLKPEQKQLLADVINHGSWGNCDTMFGDEYVMVWGYITDLAYKGGHFERRTINNRLRALYKALGMKGDRNFKQNECMQWMYDWWENGSGSILLIREDMTDEVEAWAKDFK